MSKLIGANGQACGQPLFSSSADQFHELGFQAVYGSRKFRYAKAGAVALVVGNALQARIEDVDHDATTCRVTAIGATQLLITTGSGGGALDENEYAEGFAAIEVTPGLGYLYSIKSHAAVAASTAGALNLVDGETVQVALSALSKIGLVPNPYKAVIQHPVTTATGVCVGGAIYPIAASEFGWVQTGGPGAALIAGTPAAGQPVVPVGAVAGALTVQSAELPAVAHMMKTGVDTMVNPVFWIID